LFPVESVSSQLEALVATGVPGAVAVARGPSARVQAAAGKADVATGEPLTAEHRFRIGSVTKIFVSALVLQLVTEGLLELGLAAGAAGAVSGLAASFPDAVVPIVRDRTAEAGERATVLRAELQRFPFHAASKTVLGLRGVPVAPEVRAPLRGLTDAERSEVERIVAAWLA